MYSNTINVFSAYICYDIYILKEWCHDWTDICSSVAYSIELNIGVEPSTDYISASNCLAVCILTIL